MKIFFNLQIGTDNGWLITLTVILSLLYFGVIIMVLISPLHELDPMERYDDDTSAFISQQRFENSSPENIHNKPPGDYPSQH